MYVTYSITLGLARLGLVSFVLVLQMQSPVSLNGDVDEGASDDSGSFFSITSWRYAVHIREIGLVLGSPLQWPFSFWVALSADDSGSLGSLEAADPRDFLYLQDKRTNM